MISLARFVTLPKASIIPTVFFQSQTMFMMLIVHPKYITLDYPLCLLT